MISQIIDPETCTDCPIVSMCTAWNPNGTWPHNKGIDPCRIAPGSKAKIVITEEPIPNIILEV